MVDQLPKELVLPVELRCLGLVKPKMDFNDVKNYMTDEKIHMITLSKTHYKEIFENNSSFDTDILSTHTQKKGRYKKY